MNDQFIEQMNCLSKQPRNHNDPTLNDTAKHIISVCSFNCGTFLCNS